MTMFENLKSRLVADWRTIMKFWSVRMAAIGAILYPLLISVQAMPPEVQAIFPLKYRALAALIFQMASLYVRVVVQPKLQQTPRA
jgi:hypothetical protein